MGAVPEPLATVRSDHSQDHSDVSWEHHCEVLSEISADIDRLVSVHGRDREALLPLLQDVVRLHGGVGDVAMQVIADRLGLPPAEILGVVTFYSFLHGGSAGDDEGGQRDDCGPSAPSIEHVAAPTHVVRLCRTLSCELAGASATAEQLRRELTDRQGRPGAPRVRLELVHCIGLCDRAPAMLVDDIAVGGVTPARAKAILERLTR